MIREDLIRPIDLGSAGEHLVCADLILHGLRAFQGAQGLPYDVIADLGDAILRVAVKSTISSKPRRAKALPTYQFNLVRQGVERRYSPESVDIIACVALDIHQIAYLPVSGAPTRIHFDIPGPKVYPNKHKGGNFHPEKHMTGFTLEAALERWRAYCVGRQTGWQSAA
jgi:hypothetical protein